MGEREWGDKQYGGVCVPEWQRGAQLCNLGPVGQKKVGKEMMGPFVSLTPSTA